MGEIFIKPNVAEVDFGTLAEADFNAACDSALDTFIPAASTAGSVNATLRSIRGAIGKIYYVDTAVSASGAGFTWATAFKTIAEAVTAASNYDTIIIKQGKYTLTSAVNITQVGLRLLGVQSSGMYFGQPSINTTTISPMITVNAHQVEIAFLSFHNQYAGTSLANGTTAATWRTHVHDCFFGGNDTALIGFDAGGTYDAPFTIVENCYFQHHATSGVHLNAFNSTVKNCIFQVGTAGYGIQYHPDTDDRPFGYLLDNRLITTDGTDAVGISVEGTPTAGKLLVDGNKFVGFADNNHCISKRTGYTGLNYLGITAIAIT